MSIQCKNISSVEAYSFQRNRVWFYEFFMGPSIRHQCFFLLSDEICDVCTAAPFANANPAYAMGDGWALVDQASDPDAP